MSEIVESFVGNLAVFVAAVYISPDANSKNAPLELYKVICTFIGICI